MGKGSESASRGTSSSFLHAFGRVDKGAEEKIMQARPVGAAKESEEARAALERRLGVLSKKDDLHQKVRFREEAKAFRVTCGSSCSPFVSLLCCRRKPFT